MEGQTEQRGRGRPRLRGMSRFGEKLEALLRRKRLKPGEAANLVGFSRARVYQVMETTSLPSPQWVRNLCAACEFSQQEEDALLAALFRDHFERLKASFNDDSEEG